MSRIFTLLVSLTLSLSAQAQAQAQALPQAPAAAKTKGVVEYRMEANKAYLAKDYPAFLEAVNQLLELRPNNNDYLIQQVIAAALVDKKSLAYATMLKMQQQGMAYDFTTHDDTLGIRGTEVFAYVNDLLVKAGQPFGEAQKVTDLPGSVMLPTSLVYDTHRGQYLLGTAREGAVLALQEDGSTRELVRASEANGLWGIYGLLVDSGRNRLWISSASNPSFAGFKKEEIGHSALFEFKLDSLELVATYPLPVDNRAHQLGEMTLTPAGDLFVTDQAIPVVYRLGQGQQALQPFLALPELVSLRGITSSPDGSHLYVADYELGIVVVDLQQKKVSLIQAPETLNLFGTESVHYSDQHLVVIQGGFKPQRIMRLQLDETGNAVSHVAPLAVALDLFDEPTTGWVHEGELLFLANRQRVIRGTTELTPVVVARTDVQAAANLDTPDVGNMLKHLPRREKASDQ